MPRQKIDVVAAGAFFHVMKVKEGPDTVYVVKDFGEWSDVFDTEEEAMRIFNAREGILKAIEEAH